MTVDNVMMFQIDFKSARQFTCNWRTGSATRRPTVCLQKNCASRLCGDDEFRLKRANPWTPLLFVFAVAGQIVVAFAQGAHGSDSIVLPANVREALEKQAAAMMTVHLESRTKNRAVNGQEMVDNYSDHFDTGHFHHLYDYQSGPNLLHNELAFDGEFFYYGSPDRNTPMLSKFLVSDRTYKDYWKRIFEFPYLDGAGCYFPESIAEIADQSLVEPLALYYDHEGRLTEAHEMGGDLHLSFEIPDPALIAMRKVELAAARKELQSEPISPETASNRLEAISHAQTMVPKRIETLVLSPKYGYGVVQREERTPDGKLIARTESRDWKFYQAAGIWLPTHCVKNWFAGQTTLSDFSDDPKETVESELKSVEFYQIWNVPFTLAYTNPGTVIADYSPDMRTDKFFGTYTVAADGSLHGGVVDSLVRQAAAHRERLAHRRVIRLFGIGFSVLALGSTLAIMLFVRRRKLTGH
jgi:hypothetical protein